MSQPTQERSRYITVAKKDSNNPSPNYMYVQQCDLNGLIMQQGAQKLMSGVFKQAS
jgi:hypothetical protein